MANRSHDFNGRQAFVTGAGGGIGEAITAHLLSAGCRVIAFDRKPCSEALKSIRGDLRYCKGDIRNTDALGAAFNTLHAGGLDYLVNAAGVCFMQTDRSVVDLDLQVWQDSFDINLMGAVHTARMGIPLMLGTPSPAMVHIASIVGLRSMENALDNGVLDAYQTSKAALVSLSRGIALEFGPRGLRSNTICPGAIHTPMTAHIYAEQERIQAMEARTPLKRLGQPEDIAAATAYLLSGESRFITGTDLVVDGGLMAKLG